MTSTPTSEEKYRSIPELIVARFETEKTIELLHKSAALFSQNQSKMGEWINFIQNSFANLLYEGSQLVIDAKVTVTQELDRLKSFFVQKIKAAKDRMFKVEQEKDMLQIKLGTEKDIKNHLSKRLHEMDFVNSERLGQLSSLRENLQQLEVFNIQLQKQNESQQKEFEESRKLLSKEIFNLRSQVEVLSAQKGELLEAYADFKQMFKSLNLV